MVGRCCRRGALGGLRGDPLSASPEMNNVGEGPRVWEGAVPDVEVSYPAEGSRYQLAENEPEITGKNRI